MAQQFIVCQVGRLIKLFVSLQSDSYQIIMRGQKIYVALLIGLLAMGYGWNIMLPQAIEIPLRQKPYQYSSMEFNLLYFSIFLPVFLFSIPFGTLIGKYKFSTVTIILQTFALLSSFGIPLMFDIYDSPSKPIIFILRGIYGLANQGIITLRALMMTKYFSSNYQSILSIYFSVSYFISSGALSLSPYLYQQTKKVSTVWYAGSIVSLVSFLGGFLLFFKLREIQNRSLMKKQFKQKNSQLQCRDKKKQIQEDNPKEVASQNLSSSNSFEQLQKFQEQHLNALSNPNNPFWIIILAMFFTLLAVLPIVDNLNEAFVISYNIPYVTAGFILMTVTFLTGVFLVVIGVLHQKFPGSKRTLFVVVSFTYFIALAILYVIPTISKGILTPATHYFFAILFLIFKAASITILWAFIYTSVVYFVDQKHLGTAYGILLAAMGFGECIGPIINAAILNTNSDLRVSYKSFFLYYTCISLVPILLAVWIKNRPQFDKIDEPTQSQKNQSNQSSQYMQHKFQDETQRKRKSWIYVGITFILLLAIIGGSIFLKLKLQQELLTDPLYKSLPESVSHYNLQQSKAFSIPHFRKISDHHNNQIRPAALMSRLK